MLVEGTKIKWSYEGNNTTCIIEQNNEIVMRKTVTRFVKDTPNKRLARKVAFERAMKLVSEGEILAKELRSKIWEKFRTTINQPVLG